MNRLLSGRLSSAAFTSRTGFTLVEVMISVALVLVLMIGINQIFSTVTKTVSAGQTLSGIVRDNRAVQSVIYGDARTMVTGGGPVLAINSSVQLAYRNRADELSDGDNKVFTVDIDGDNAYTGVGENLDPTLDAWNYYKTTERNHRVDTVSFFCRDLYRRQTGNDGYFVQPYSASEAWVSYGHLNQNNNAVPPATKVAYGPGVAPVASNPHNFYATDWSVGRVAMLLGGVDVNGDGQVGIAGTDPINDRNGTAQFFYPRAAATNELRPLQFSTVATDGATLRSSRYDLAGTTITQFQNDVLVQAAAEPEWWQRLVFGSATYPATAGPTNYISYRFAADRYFVRPLTSAAAAQASPILLSGCTQFIVEYAGNYVAQDGATGAVTGNYDDVAGFTDIETDFVIETINTQPVKRMRWYGAYRDVNGDGLFVASATSPDVVPLRDLRPAAAPFERVLPIRGTPPGAGADTLAQYVCVWGPTVATYLPAVPTVLPPRPQYIRITAVIDDPSGRIAEGQSYEYVIKVP